MGQWLAKKWKNQWPLLIYEFAKCSVDKRTDYCNWKTLFCLSGISSLAVSGLVPDPAGVQPHLMFVSLNDVLILISSALLIMSFLVSFSLGCVKSLVMEVACLRSYFVLVAPASCLVSLSSLSSYTCSSYTSIICLCPGRGIPLVLLILRFLTFSPIKGSFSGFSLFESKV